RKSGPYGAPPALRLSRSANGCQRAVVLRGLERDPDRRAAVPSEDSDVPFSRELDSMKTHELRTRTPRRCPGLSHSPSLVRILQGRRLRIWRVRTRSFSP